jgi:glycosyltransferase involved in cell wall biosynthesis
VHFPLVQHPVLYFKKSVIGILDLTTLRYYNPAKNKYIFWIKQKVYAAVIFIATRKAKHIITISNYVRDDIIKNFKIYPAKVTTTYNSADELPKPGIPVDSLVNKKFIMYVGRHQPHKNLPRLIEAHQQLLAKNPDLLLAIVGKEDATTDLLRSKIQDPRSIVFTGFVTDAQLRWLYENTACYVFPSLSEGFGLPGLEAMVHGAPVASSNATCLPEIYGDAVHYFDPLNVGDIASKIEDILSDNSLRADLIARGKTQASKYSWQKMAEQTLEIYQQALNK